MSFSLIILLIAFAVSETNFYFYDINYSHRYVIDALKFPSNKIPAATYYFRVPVDIIEEKKIMIQVKQNDIANFKMKVCAFYQYPSNSEIISENNTFDLEIFSKSIYNGYNNFIYKIQNLKKEEKIKYLVFTILNYETLEFLSVYVYPSKLDYFDPEEMYKEINFNNISYMKEEIINKTALSQNKGIFFFVLENKELEKNKLIRVKFDKNYSPEIIFMVAGLKERPLTKEMLKDSVASFQPLLKSLTRDEEYTIYEYPIENEEINKQKYNVIALGIIESVDFISLYIGSES